MATYNNEYYAKQQQYPSQSILNASNISIKNHKNETVTTNMYDFSNDFLGIPKNGKASVSNSFNRFKHTEGLDYSSSNITYVFFTRPHMNLMYNNTIQDSFIRSMQGSSPDSTAHQVLRNLDGLAEGASDSDNTFNYILSNSVESFETKDNILKTKDLAENFSGGKLTLGDSMTDSLMSDTFTINYTEYSDMSITIMHKVWVDYIHMVKKNMAAPYICKKSPNATAHAATSNGTGYNTGTDGATRTVDYVKDKIIDYACSVYVFRLAEDGMTIKYYAKYTGVFPTTIPYSAFSYTAGENKLKQLSISYTYSFKEDMNPEILKEFKLLTSQPVKDSQDKIPQLKYNWCDSVYITQREGFNGNTDNLLIFKKNNKSK